MKFTRDKARHWEVQSGWRLNTFCFESCLCVVLCVSGCVCSMSEVPRKGEALGLSSIIII